MTIISSAQETSVAISASQQHVIITTSGGVASDGAAIYGAASYNQVAVLNYGFLYGGDGVSLFGANAEVQNFGQISGQNGVAIGGANARVYNSGTITGDIGLYLFGSNATVQNNGTISATTWGVEISTSSGTTRLINTGLISGTFLSLSVLGSGTVAIRNTGLMDGNVQLGSGFNYFDSRGGIVNGDIDGGGSTDIIYAGNTGNTLSGYAGDDQLAGGAGDDFLNGGTGADRMIGGAGDDVYIVDDALDIIVERLDKGHDIVLTGVSYTLAPGVHVEELTAAGSTDTDPLELTGNAYAQTITGNAGANILKDGRGAGDVLQGLAGNDTYVILSAGTKIVEGAAEGTADRILSYVSYALEEGVGIERLMTNSTLGTAAIDLIGNEVAQLVIGNAGVNWLDGRGGSDTLTGGGGADVFVFSVAPPTGVDKITDFVADVDRIALAQSAFAAIGAPGALAAAAFWSSTTGLAHDATDRVIYDSDDGRLWYDADGTGAIAPVLFATLGTGLALDAADFLVI